MKNFNFDYSFIFRKEERINRLERDLADEKRKSERVLENMVNIFLRSFFINKKSNSRIPN